MLTGELWSLERSGVPCDWLNFARAFSSLCYVCERSWERRPHTIWKPKTREGACCFELQWRFVSVLLYSNYVSFMLANKAQKQQHYIASSFHLFATRFRNPSDEILLTMAGFFCTSNMIIETRRTSQNTRNTVSDYKAEQNFQINTVYNFLTFFIELWQICQTRTSDIFDNKCKFQFCFFF